MAYDPLDVASFYTVMFAARNDVYSQWTPDGWRPARRPLTGEIIIAGLAGTGPSISGYMIAPGSTSHVVALDFDTDNGLEQALQLAVFMDEQALPAYVETSGQRAHLWILLDRASPAIAIRAGVRGLLQGAELPADDERIEIRPGSDHVTDGGLGHALRLPLMPSPKTGRRGRLLYASGEPMPGSLAQIMLAMQEASSEKLLAWGERWHRPPVATMPPLYRSPRTYPDDDEASASELLRSLWGALDAVPGKVFSCPAGAYHAHNDVHKGCRVFPDDRRVLCHKPGCILSNDGRGRGTYELRKLAPTAA